MYTKILPRNRVNQVEYDPNILEHMTFRNQLSDPPKEIGTSSVQYELETVYLFVSSFVRNRNQFPDPGYFKVTLPEVHCDVVSLELQGGVIPNSGGVTGDGYILLDIPEVNHIETVAGDKYFGVLTLQPHPNPGFLNIDRGSLMGLPCVFKQPKKLSSLTITLRHPDSSSVNFGSESATAPANLAVQTSFTFVIRKRVPRRVGIEKDFRAIQS